MQKKKTETLSFKIDTDFKEKLQERATEEKRNMSNFVIKVLTEYLEKIEEAKRTLQ